MCNGLKYRPRFPAKVSCEGLKANTPVVMSTPNARILVLITPFPERNQRSLEKWLILALGQKAYMNLACL